MHRAAAVAVLVLCAASARAAPKHAAKVVLIGIDGVSLNLLVPFIERGVTPHMGQLVQSGASGHLNSIWPLRTPQVWTSVVTGKLPGQHGIWDHFSNTYYNPPEFRTKTKQRVTSEQRKSAALWTLLDAKGIRTLTVGWMASWPAEPLEHGTIVAPVELMGDKRQTTIKGSFYRGELMVTPTALTSRVDRLIVDPSNVAAAELSLFADIPPEGSPLYRLPHLQRYVYTLQWSIARAKSVEALTLGLLDQPDPEVVLSYFQCPDSLLHRFWIFHKDAAAIRQRLQTHGIPTDHADELHRRFGKVVEACYRDVDARVGRIVDATVGPNTLVMIVSDHGFGHAPIPHQLKGEPYSGDHLDEGIIVAKGPGIAAGSVIENRSVLDITPTILHALGQPIARDMRGRVIDSFFDLKTRPVEMIDTYEASPQLEAPHADGWPVRKNPRRSSAEQLAAARKKGFDALEGPGSNRSKMAREPRNP